MSEPKVKWIQYADGREEIKIGNVVFAGFGCYHKFSPIEYAEQQGIKPEQRQ